MSIHQKKNEERSDPMMTLLLSFRVEPIGTHSMYTDIYLYQYQNFLGLRPYAGLSCLYLHV